MYYIALIILVIISIFVNDIRKYFEKQKEKRFDYLRGLKEGDEITIQRFGEFQGTTVTCNVVRNIQCLDSIKLIHTYGIQCELTLNYDAKEFRKVIKLNKK